MYLEYLTIYGFKSFAAKTILDFRPAQQKNRVGITAIVGPNGSGKSNVVDAIRWGLGEQSSKMLRGKKSGDVIFAGSDKKTRNSRAEVSIRLNNDDKKIDLDYSEIELTRQIFRNGESDYLINGQKSRLQDIHYLLAQANIGQKSYTVIGQGMIDTVLNSTPQQRKEFFDEAAGIRQYQIKKDRAINKLAASKENLIQGEIQLQEITPRLRSLGRQMKRWQQREEIMASLNEKLNIYYSYHWQEINSNLKEQLDKKIYLEDLKKSKQTILDSLQNQMQTLATTSDGSVSQFDNLQAEYNKLQSQKNQLAQELAQWQGQQNNEWAKNGQQSLTFYQNQLNNLDFEINQNKQELTKTYKKIKLNKENLKTLETNYQKLIREVKSLKNSIFSKLDFNKNSQPDNLNEIKTNILNYLDKLIKCFTAILKQPAAKNKFQTDFTNLVQNIKNTLNKLPTQPGEINFKKWQIKLDDLEQEKNKQNQEILELKGQLKYLDEKVKNITTKISAMENQKNIVATNLKENKGNDKNKSNLQEKIKDLSAQISALDVKQNEISNNLSAYNQNEERKKKEIFTKQQSALAAQKELNELNQNLTNCEIQLARWQTKKDDLKHSALSDFKKSWDELTSSWKNTLIEKNLEITKIKNEIQQLKGKKESLGLIDDETIREFDEINERHGWLKQQTTDLRGAIKSLEKIINDLDNKIEDKFTTNIKLINEKFSHYFSILFSGGKAELKIKRGQIQANKSDQEINNDEEIKEKNIVSGKETIIGIEIMATPPGKRLQNINILSGGEKALTSIALICAIIANNNSPFVVLDEVDAALDEANSIRFAQILEKLSNKTQFIVVTHNRATMEKAQLLYGVTMRDNGISKLLSIKLEEGKQYTNR